MYCTVKIRGLYSLFVFFGHMFDNLDVLKIYFENLLDEFSVRDIARLADISPSTASKVIKEFVNKGILNLREYKNILLSSANKDHELFKDMKKFYNIQKLKKSGLINELNKFYYNPTIILFGSYSNGEDVNTSDIDIVVFSEIKKNFQKTSLYEKKLGKELQIFCFNSVSSVKNIGLLNNMINGTILQGGVEWISKDVLRTV